ncbi:MAG: exodeoxyribonuclease VII small subunit [Bacteroidaceae bacterium]|nr:exodeoxyribonuclease VII small subunit [Bacteroidaceae bacterium]
MKYEEAIKRLEEIVSKIESGSLDVDQLATKLEEAKRLIQFCQSILTQVGEEIDQILGEQ